jgi:hypothetical protein
MPELNTAIPTQKQTALGFYLTAREAYEMWKADPDNVMIVDVRTPPKNISSLAIHRHGRQRARPWANFPAIARFASKHHRRLLTDKVRHC